MPAKKAKTFELPMIVGKLELVTRYSWEEAIDNLNGNADKNQLIANLMFLDNNDDRYNACFFLNGNIPISQSMPYNLYIQRINEADSFMVYNTNPDGNIE